MFPPSQSRATISPKSRTGVPRGCGLDDRTDDGFERNAIRSIVAHERFEHVLRVEGDIPSGVAQPLGREPLGAQRLVECSTVRGGGDDDRGSILAERVREKMPRRSR